MKKVLAKVVDFAHSVLHIAVGPNLAPVRKVVAGGIAAALVFLAQSAGLHIPVAFIDHLAAALAGTAVAYIAKP